MELFRELSSIEWNGFFFSYTKCCKGDNSFHLTYFLLIYLLSNNFFFKCFVENDSRPPPIIRIGPQNQTLATDETAFLHCDAIGNPTPTIRWYKNGNILSPDDVRIQQKSTGTLQISGTDEGLLLITVFHFICSLFAVEHTIRIV